MEAPDPGRRSSRDALAEQMLAELYRDRVDEVADDIIDKLAEVFPGAVGELGKRFRDDVMERAARLLRGALHALSTGESLEPLGPVVEQVARQRRDQQVSQEMIFFGYRFLQQALFERIAEDVQGHAHASRLLGALALRQLEFQWMVTRRVAAAFDTGPDVLAANREVSMQVLLEALAGLRPGPAQLNHHATHFGLLLPLDHLAVTVPIEEGDRPGSLDTPAIRTMARSNPWSVVGVLDGRAVVLSRGVPWELDLPWGGCPLPPEAVDQPITVADLVHRATAAADVVGRLGLAHGDADELAPFTAVAALPADRREAFLRSCFGSLYGNSKGDPLLEAVAVSMRCANRREAAQELHVHPNTLDYRLSRFRELTGLDLRSPVDRMRCDLGLFLTGLIRS